MEIKLTLLKDYDVYELYRILSNERRRLEAENSKHTDMIRLLVGNENNEWAKSRLDGENCGMRINNGYIEIIDNITNQLKPLVHKVIGG